MSNPNNRVLGRIGARELTLAEEALVIGGSGPRTQTVCTVPNLQASFLDGDPGECG